MINSLTGGLEFPKNSFQEQNDESDIEKITQLDINANYNPVPSM